jgi:hypothetical protein
MRKNENIFFTAYYDFFQKLSSTKLAFKFRKKQNEKKLNTFEVMTEKPFLTNPSGEWRHLEPK